MPRRPRPAEFSERATERLIFFSDAVVAIAMTLLALDLPVPSGRTTSDFLQSVRDNEAAYIAFLISFLVIAVHWFSHHRLFDYLAHTDRRLRRLNMLWLLVIVLLPFATRVLNSPATDSSQTLALRFAFYALLQTGAYVLFVAMVHTMASGHLLSEHAPPHFVRRTDWEFSGLIVGFGLSIPLFFATSYAWALWIVGPTISGRLAARMTKTQPDVG